MENMAKKPQEKKPGTKPRLVESAGTEQEAKAPDTKRSPQVGEGLLKAAAQERRIDTMSKRVDSKMSREDAGWDQIADKHAQDRQLAEKDAKKTELAAIDAGWDEAEEKKAPNTERSPQPKGVRTEKRIDAMGRRVDLEMDREDSEKRIDAMGKRVDANIKARADFEKMSPTDRALHNLEVIAIHNETDVDLQRAQQEAKEKQELYTETVGAAGSIDALKNVVDMIGTVETSDGTKMSAKDVKGWIDMAVQFPDSIAMNNITRNYGLREKVMELTKGARTEKRIDAMGKRVDEKMGRIDAALAKNQPKPDVQATLDARKAEWEADFITKTPEEADFFKRGESVKGDTMPEGIGELNNEEYEVASAAAEQIPVLEQQLSRYEQALKDRGITDIDEAMNKRAIGGFAEKAKGFFGGLFSKKTREINSLMETYASVRDAHDAAKETLAKRRPMTEDQKELRRLQNQSRLGSGSGSEGRFGSKFGR